MKIWINGKLVNKKAATVSIFDRGFLYGDGVFETMRSYGRAVFKIDEHLSRLCNSLRVAKIKIPHSKSFLKKQIYRMLKINRLSNAYIRLTVTRGIGTVGLARIKGGKPTVVIFVNKLTPYPGKMYKDGITTRIVKIRQNENSPISGIKSVGFLNNILTRLEAKEEGCDDAIMMNSKGLICESTVSNIFLVKGKKLITPSLESGVLPGITRSAILKMAKKVKLKTKQARVTRTALYSADEIFLTNSLMEVMPVAKVDNRIIGKGKPGPITKKIHNEYKKLTIPSF